MARNLTEWGRLLEEAGVTAPPNEPSQIARAATASRDGQIGGYEQCKMSGRSAVLMRLCYEWSLSRIYRVEPGVGVKLRRLVIEGFRGIRQLDWVVPQGVVALVGPGDVGKTTVLDAIELVLSPRWNPVISDHDFYSSDTRSPVLIEATVGQIPERLLSEAKYGLEVRGLADNGDLHDEPAEGDELVLTVRLTIGPSLEPEWAVINDRQTEPRRITAEDRAALGARRLGDDADRHLSWGQGSALIAAGRDHQTEVRQVLADSQREMRLASRATAPKGLDLLVARAATAARQMGAGPAADAMTAEIDADSVAARGSSLSLHADGLPLKRAGAGTRRLVALGLQHANVDSGSVLLIDELETGLEPFRLRHLVRLLRSTMISHDGSRVGQRILTTHSALALTELDASEVCVARRSPDGQMTLTTVQPELQALVRGEPEAILSKRVLVCEGKTEMALVRAMEAVWAPEHGGNPLSHDGVAVAFGSGTQTGDRAASLRLLGYEVGILADSDRPLHPPADELQRRGVTVVQWQGEVSTEGRVFDDLPWSAVCDLVRLRAEDIGSHAAVRDAIWSSLDRAAPDALTPEEWVESGDVDETNCRSAIAKAANRQGWYKSLSDGEHLGAAVVEAWGGIEGSALREDLQSVASWIYRDNG